MRSIRTNRGVLVGLLAFALLGCGRQFGFQSGTYRGQADPGSVDETLRNGTVLVIDEPARTATLRVPGTADVALRLMDLPESAWFRGCPTNTSTAVMETYALAPDPLQVGSRRFVAPLLTTECGLDSDPASNPVLVAGGGPRESGGGACSTGVDCLRFRPQ